MKLDDAHYKLVDQMEALVQSPPSLMKASSLTVKGPVVFSKGVVIKGECVIEAEGGEPVVLEAGEYTGNIKITKKELVAA